MVMKTIPCNLLPKDTTDAWVLIRSFLLVAVMLVFGVQISALHIDWLNLARPAWDKSVE